MNAINPDIFIYLENSCSYIEVNMFIIQLKMSRGVEYKKVR